MDRLLTCLPRRTTRIIPREAIPQADGWFSRIVLWLLKWTGVRFVAEENVESISFETIIFDPEQLVQSLRLTSKQLDLIYNRRAKYLVVGNDCYRGIVKWGNDKMLLFRHDMSVACGRDVRICGIKVVLVPWLEGYALLPELKDQE